MNQSSFSEITDKPFFPYIIISVISFLTYFQVYGFEFSHDDFYSVLPVPDIEKLSAIFRYFTEPVLFLSPITGELEPLSYFRPLATSTLTIDFFLFGKENPGWLHFENLILHTINSCLFFLVGRQLLKENLSALFAACLYVVFPLSTEIVSIYHYRVDHVTSFFIFFSLFVTLRNTKKSWCWQVAVLFLFAMLSKEAAISLFVLIPLFRHFRHQILKPYEIFIALGIPMLIYWPLRYNALGSFLKVEGAIDFETATHRLTSLDWLFYVAESFFQKFIYIVAPFRIPPKVFLLDEVNIYFVIGGISLFVAFSLTACFYLKEPNLYRLLSASFIISWIPVSSLLIRVPDFVSPRFFYYPSPWIVLLLTLLVVKIPRRNILLFFAAMLLTVWCASSYYQKFMYRNNFVKNLGILSFTPDNRETLWVVANEYAKRKQYKRAIHHFYRFLNESDKNAIGIKREQSYQAHLMIADLHLKLNEPQNALIILNGSKSYFSDRAEIYWLLAITHWRVGNKQEAANTIAEGSKNVKGFEKYQNLFDEFIKEQSAAETSR